MRVRDEREFEAALERIAEGATLRGCGLPKSTVQNRAERDDTFARRLAAAQQTGRLRRRLKPLAGAGEMTRDELLAVIAGEARAGRGWACKLMLDLLDAEATGSAVPARYLELLD